MIPRLDFQIHDVFVNAFIFPTFKEDKDKFYILAKDFEKKIDENNLANKIVSAVDKFSGYEWNKKVIPVYLLPENSPFKSFAKTNLESDTPGIVLRILPDFNQMIHIIIHEIVHINQMQSEFWSKKNPYFWKDEKKNNIGTELCADIVTVYVIRELFGSDSEQERKMFEFLQTTGEINKNKHIELMKHLDVWDLNEKTLKAFIENE